MTSILVIDDEPVILELVSEVMSDHRVLTAASGAEARAIVARGEAFDVAVVDKNLPDASGLELVRWLRTARPECQALIMTGYPSLDSAVEAIAAGATDYLIKPMRDINEMRLRIDNAAERVRRARAERALTVALKESEERYRELFQASPDAVVVLDAETRTVIDANDAAERLYARSRAELIGRSAHELTAADPAPMQCEAGLIARNESRADGTTVAVEVTTTIAHDRGRAIAVEVVRDVSERERLAVERRVLEQRLVRSGQLEAMGKLAAGIAHDFNNMLCVVAVSSDLAGQALDEDPALVRDELTQINGAVESATALTRQLLAFSGRQLTRKQRVDINACIDGIGKLLRRALGSRVKLDHRLAAEPLAIEIDPTHLEQVITNLAINARDAMPNGGVVTIATASAEVERVRGVRLEVTDTGTGIPPDVLESIFDPFFTTKAPEKGTGLGLATVQEIVKQAKGTMEVRSEVGAGTTFTMWFPASQGAIHDQTRAQPLAIPAGRGENVLLVEDDPQLRELATRVLIRGGYAVHAAASGEDALSHARTARLDALVTDIELPGINGVELARKLGECAPDLRVLFVSGMAGDPRARDARRSRFLPKPFSSDALMSAIRRVLDGEP